MGMAVTVAAVGDQAEVEKVSIGEAALTLLSFVPKIIGALVTLFRPSTMRPSVLRTGSPYTNAANCSCVSNVAK